MTLNHRTLLLPVLLAAALVGCNRGPDPGQTLPPGAVPAGASVRYAPRTDLMWVGAPEAVPPRWNSTGYPPLRSMRLFPHTPDRDLVATLNADKKKKILDPTAFTETYMPAVADRIARLTEARFGTPFAPAVRLPDWDDTSKGRWEKKGPQGVTFLSWQADREHAAQLAAALKLEEPTLARGAVVYRRWCMQCHGPSGAGEPSQAVENGPPPRDFRQGMFKYVTAFPPSAVPKKAGLGASGKPRRDDLRRTVRRGLDGTIMPAFPGLTEQELDDVVSYVIHLSVRGETEFETLKRVMRNIEEEEEFAEYTPAVADWLFAQYEMAVLYNWGVAAAHPILVPPPVERTELERLRSAVRGYQLFKLECAGCHADYGRSQQLKWDIWGGVIQPRNLLLGAYRGGNRGEDLYARIYGGIWPSAMPEFQTKYGKREPGQPDRIWDIVHFLQALPDPNLRKRMEALDAEVKFEP